MSKVMKGASANVSTGRSSVLVAAAILISRFSGVIREAVLAATLGATSRGAEAFSFALQIPKLMQNLLGEGALSASFIPVYSRELETDKNLARHTASAVFALLFGLVGLLTVLLMSFAEPICSVIALGASDERVSSYAELVQIMAPGIAFIVLAAWCLGVLSSHRQFFLSYVAGVVWNAAIIFFALYAASNDRDSMAIARFASMGVFLGGLAQFLIQIPKVYKTAKPLIPNWALAKESIKEVAKRFVPGVASRGVVTLNTFVDVALASFLVQGANTLLIKTQTLYLLPISVFAVSVASVELPELSRETTLEAQSAQRLNISAERVSFFLIFSAVAFMVCGKTVVQALLGRGQFGIDESVAVWLCLSIMSLGLLASGLSRLLQSASYANADVSGPAKIAALRLGIAAAIGALLMLPLDHFVISQGLLQTQSEPSFEMLSTEVRDNPTFVHLGVLGLAVGSAVASWVEFWMLRKRLGSIGQAVRFSKLLAPLGFAIFTAVCFAVAVSFALQDLPAIINACVSIGVSGASYVFVAARMGHRTAVDLLATATGFLARFKAAK